MAKRKLHDDFDPNKSDSEDLDYGDDDAPKQHRPKKRRNRSQPRKPSKRQRRNAYGSSDEDIEEDSEDFTEEEASFDESEDEEETTVNPKTGRAVRSATKKQVNYGEDSDEDILAAEESDDPIQSESKPRRAKMGSLVVKLKVPGSSQTHSFVGGKAPMKSTNGGAGRRRSSRISHDDEQPLVALTDSGKHQVVTRAGTATPEPESRSTRATKALAKPPSAILEASHEDSQDDPDTALVDDPMQINAGDTQADDDAVGVPVGEVQESEDEDDEPVKGRSTRVRRPSPTPQPLSQEAGRPRRNLRSGKQGAEASSDFEPDPDGAEDEDMSESDGMLKPGKASSNDESQGGRRSARNSRKTASQRSRSRRIESEDEVDELDPDEIADEAADLAEDNRRNKRTRNGRSTRNQEAFESSLRTRGQRPDYRIIRPELLVQAEEDDNAPAATPSKRGRGGAGAVYRSLFQTAGPFGGFGGPAPIFGGQPTGGVDSDSSDDELGVKNPQQVGGTVGMTPNSAFPKPYAAQTHNADPIQGAGGGPPGLGKVKDRKALADADPLGVDPNVGFDSVGGLDDHIDRLKEMVALPLLYPEVFQRFHVTPPRGVLFHGPPGTGKTLLARALASSVSSHGRKVTFYMRKGADALSKWVGEAEKQLRLLFEEARKNQPSIIFFDEIDGLAPVRSSKQEQIHASIVATLLALMDGMDGRGQVIVIGATNRPDSVDPALRRPGRFDREFYFPLPSVKARRAIIDIHTKGWEPALAPKFKDQLAELTKGYGGADLRALCTEAALNAVQGTYPQIYSSNKKLIIDPSTIKVLAKDFMISVGKIVPSSERSAASGAAPLKSDIEPLLRKPLEKLVNLVDQAIPRKKQITALEEAKYDDREDELGFERENMQRQFESSRVFRPRLLIKGAQGMGQQYLGAALLSKLEGLHVQNFGLSVLLSDSTRSPEAAIIQLFEEVKRHKPSIIYIPQVDAWYRNLSESAIKMFVGLLRGIPPTEPILLLGITEYFATEEEIPPEMLRDLFGYSLKSHFELRQPGKESRFEFFGHIMQYVVKPPPEFPDPEGRKPRQLAILPVAVEPERVVAPTKQDLKAQKKKDRTVLNMLKLNIQQVMDQIKLKYKKFRTPAIEDSVISYLYDEQLPQLPAGEMTEEQKLEQAARRPYELDTDDKGITGLREVATNKFFYNLEIVTIEKRLSNGYYKRPKDFLADIKRLAKDAKALQDQDRILKANEMLANVEVDMSTLEMQYPGLVADCEAVYEREQLREQERLQKEREAFQRGDAIPRIIPNVPPPTGSKTTTETTGPVVLGEELAGRALLPPHIPRGLEGPSPESHRWSNGVSHQTNGSHVPSRPQEDSEMYDASQDPKQIEQNPQNTPLTKERSQRSLLTHLPSNSHVEHYENSASTTNSGQKTSDKSRSSNAYSGNTLQSNGDKHPDFSLLQPASGGSQLPDTQSSQSQAQSQGLSPLARREPPQRPVPVSALLNETSAPSTDKASHLIVDDVHFANLQQEFVHRSSGLSVEQLEQVQAAMMSAIWQYRREWNRVKVSKEVLESFNDTIKDIEACQRINKASQDDA